MLVLAIDFDQVIHDNHNPAEGRKMGPPIEGAKETIGRLHRKGYQIVVFSVWATESGQKVIEEWMRYYDIYFDGITNIKPDAIAFIDDKAIKFTNWEEIPEQVKKLKLNKLT